jgi:hypothetical protein
MGHFSQKIRLKQPILQACDEWWAHFSVEIGKGLLPSLHFEFLCGARQPIN